uniref:DNA mismatch repair proteins mutS family domain-containing protein n=1 Tax=Denticeps clupeoides TaxID=299321 RepID=A0AAY4E661_9TELE
SFRTAAEPRRSSSSSRPPCARWVYLSVLMLHGQVGLSFYDSLDYTLHFMPDIADSSGLHLLERVVQEISPQVIVTSAKQERCMAHFLRGLGSNPDYKPEVVVYPNSDFGLEVAKQRLLSAHLPLLPASITENEKIPYLSSCIPFDSVLMVRLLVAILLSVIVMHSTLRTMGALLKCLDRRRVGVELEDSSVGVPIMHFRTYTLNDVVYVDRDTYSVLQIFKSELHPSVYKLQSGEKEGLSLYGSFYFCKRDWFLRPTRDLAVLMRRQEVVRFFTSPRNSDSFNTLKSCLRNIRSIPVQSTLILVVSFNHSFMQHTLISFCHRLYTVYNGVCIRDTVRSLPQSIQLFHEISEAFTEDLFYIASLISKVVDFESSLAENRFTIKPNVDPAVDEKKRKMMGLSDFLTDVARSELEQLDSRIPSCSVIYIPLIGFLLSIPRLPNMVEKEDMEIEGLDFMFLSEERLHYRSERTKELDDLLGDLHCVIRDMETAVMTQLQAVVLQRSSCLYKVLSLCAELDCLLALAQASQDYGYCSPTLTLHGPLSLIKARHPLLELCSPVFVPNPFTSSDQEGKVKVLTGPNSSGKSIYLKQVGLIVFMALIGSDVPAKEAQICLVDCIFTRMQSRESVSVGLSTFMIDLNQMTQALNQSTGNSLVLIDEFGKGTNTVDGLSLLAACLSHWLSNPATQCPHVLLATNFHSLLQLDLLPQSPLLSLLVGWRKNILERCSVFLRFLSLDLDDPSLELQHYMEELLTFDAVK